MRIAAEVNRCLSIVSSASGEVSLNLRRCDRLRQSILGWAFTGKLVDQDPGDESADILIERIRKERDEKGTSTRKGKR